MHTRSPRFQRTIRRTILTLVGCLTLTSAVLAQSYTYTTVEVPATWGSMTSITGLTDGGSLSVTYIPPFTGIPPTGPMEGTRRSGRYDAPTKKWLKLGTTAQIAQVSDINGTGVSIGTYRDGAYSMWSGVLKPLIVPGVSDVSVEGINRADWVVGSGDVDGRHVGILTTSKGQNPLIATFDLPQARGMRALGLSDHADVTRVDVVGTYWIDDGDGGSTELGWRYHSTGDPTIAGSIETIQAPCGGLTYVMDINLHGLMAVMCYTATVEDDVFVEAYTSYAYDGTTWTVLDVPGSLDTVVRRVNNHGQFAGWYRDHGWDEYGFIAYPATGQPLASR